MADKIIPPEEPKFPQAQIANPVVFTDDKFNQFLFIIYYTNPTRNSVRLILDDGSIKVWITRDKFLKLMTDILNGTLLRECQYTLMRIRESLNTYGKFYYYDRVKNIFKELQELDDFEHIRPKDLIEETRRPAEELKKTDLFKPISKQYNTDVLDKSNFAGPKKIFNNLISNITRDFKKKKKKMI